MHVEHTLPLDVPKLLVAMDGRGMGKNAEYQRAWTMDGPWMDHGWTMVADFDVCLS